MTNPFRFSVLVVILVLASLVASAQSKKNKLQQQKAGLEKDIANTSKLIQETQKNSKLNAQQLKLIESQMIQFEELIEKTGSEMSAIDEEINGKKRNMSALQTELTGMKQQYARMVYLAYLTRRPANRLVYLFSAKSFSQAWRRMRYFREYASIRKRQMLRIIETVANINIVLTELEALREDKNELISDREKQQSQLEQHKKEKDKLLKDLKKQENKLRSDLKKQQKQAAEIQRKIQKLIEDEIEASKTKKNVVNAGSTSTGTNAKPNNTYQMTPEEAKLSGTFAGSKGSLPWPVAQGTITGRFGEHPHPVLPEIRIKNNGIDITCPSGSNARAIYSGTVSAVISAPNGTRLIMIRHGEYLSVYSNIASTTLKSGVSVTSKQNIGPVASDENGSLILHFEIWREKEPQNPESWLSK